MATTVTPGTPVSFPIGAFDTITVTASPASVGTVSFTAGALSDLRSDVSAGVCNNIYGPYGVPGTVTISVTSGVVTYVTSDYLAITSNTTLTLADHNGKTLRVATGVALTKPDLGSSFSCIIEVDVGGTITLVSSGGLKFADSSSPSGSTTTRTRTQANNPSGFVLKGTSTAGTDSLSGS